MLSFGQMSAFMKFIKLRMISQIIRLTAPILRLEKCQMNGGMHNVTAIAARVGMTMANGWIVLSSASKLSMVG